MDRSGHAPRGRSKPTSRIAALRSTASSVIAPGGCRRERPVLRSHPWPVSPPYKRATACPSLELIGNLVEPGLGACLVLLAARRAGDTNRADHLIADLDRQRPLCRDDPGQMHCASCRVVLDPLGELA